MSLIGVWIVKASLLVTDAAGHHPIKPISNDGAEAIANVCAPTQAPTHCAALLVVLSFRESGYNPNASHDAGRGCGAFGVLCTRPHATWLEQTKSAWAIVVESATKCKEALALYASGSCTNAAGIAISRARLTEAKRIAGALPLESDGDKS